MTCFAPISGPFTQILVFLAGLATLLGYWGAGWLLMRVLRWQLPSPWRTVVATLAGFQLNALGIAALAISGMASRPVMIGAWAGVSLIGTCCWVWNLRSTKACLAIRSIPHLCWIPLSACLAANAINLLIALAPSSKFDELYYHMLLPSRIVHDHELIYYRYPWYCGALAMMYYQIASVPLHAMALPDAPNVVSWGLAVMLQWFAWKLLTARNESFGLASLIVAAFAVGLYPAVNQVAGGPHSLSDLATATAVVALLGQAELRPVWGDWPWLGTCSVASLVAASTKASMVPLSCTIVLCSLMLVCWTSTSLANKFRLTRLAAMPWLVGYVPILLYTYTLTGSPFGAMFCNMVPWTVYDVPAIQTEFQQSYQMTFSTIWLYAPYFPLNWSVLVWAGVVSWPFIRGVSWSRKGLALGLLLVQSGVMLFFVGWEMRYMGGLQYGLLIAIALLLGPRMARLTASMSGLVVGSALFVYPVLAVQSYYASQFFPVTLGLQDRESFVRAKTAFRADFIDLDRILPPDAVVFAGCGRVLDSVYCPRPPIFHPDDLVLVRGAPTYLLIVADVGPADLVVPGFRRGSLVYENPEAIIGAYRTPGRPPMIGHARVYHLLADGEGL
jgi:hypothetical protein